MRKPASIRRWADPARARRAGWLAACLLSCAGVAHAQPTPEEDRAAFARFYQERFPGVALERYVDGALMLSPDAKAQFDSIMEFPPFQAEIDRGKKLWETPFANGATYADCLPEGGRVAARYPVYDNASDKVVTFEMALNACRKRNGEAEYRHDDRKTMGALTAYARSLSDGTRVDVRVEGAGALAKYENGKRLFFTRIGQFNFSCASCHLKLAGQILRTEIISPAIGATTHWPVFRAGDNLNTLQMRYRRCMEQVRAVPFAAGGEDLNNLEYFHSYLSNGLPLRASVYRK